MTASATPLGQLLIDRGLIGQEDLERALELQRERGDKVGKILVDMGYLAQRDLITALSEQLGLPLARIAAPPSGPETEGMSPRFLRQAVIFPVAVEDGTLALAMPTLSTSRPSTPSALSPNWKSPRNSPPSRKSSTPSTAITPMAVGGPPRPGSTLSMKTIWNTFATWRAKPRSFASSMR